MRGSISKTAYGWQVTVDQGRDPFTHKRRRTAKTFATFAEAQDGLPAMLQAARGRTPAPKALTVGALLDQWLAHVEADLSPNTVAGYRKKVETYLRPALGDLPLGKLTKATIATLYSTLRQRGLSANTVRRAHACLSGALSLAVEWGWLSENPCPRPPSQPRRDVEAPDVDEVAKVFAECGADTRDAALLAIATGARRGELCGLRWSDWKRTSLTFRRAIADDLSVLDAHRKSRLRVVAIDASTDELLHARYARAAQDALAAGISLSDSGYILSEEPGQRTPLKPERITGRWRDAAKRAGVSVRFHDLRHLSVTSLLAAGQPIPNVARRHGHGPDVMLRTYAHAIDQADTQAAEIMGEVARRVSGSRPARPRRAGP